MENVILSGSYELVSDEKNNVTNKGVRLNATT
jgi:hypothetical protein